MPFTLRAQADEHVPGRRRAGRRHRGGHQGRARRAARPLHPRAGRRRSTAAHRRARSEILATVDRLADHALRTLAVAYRPLPDSRAAARGRVDGAGPRVPRHGRHHRPARAGGEGGDRRSARRRRADHHDHRRPSAHRGAHRGRARHRRARRHACSPAPRSTALDDDALRAAVREVSVVRAGGTRAQAAHRRLRCKRTGTSSR